jgi:peptide/nickel transport system ATP-binding protein
MAEILLDVKDIRIHYESVRGVYKVVDGVDVTIYRNEIFGLAGESGCGKSTLVEGILRLVKPPGKITSGTATFFPFHTDSEGVDLVSLDDEALRDIRWKHLSYIPQGSMNSLNPVMRIGEQMLDAISTHSRMPREEAETRINEMLSLVGLSKRSTRAYPHELSGGMKQRVIIAMAMLLGPELVVADEPTTALDVNVQRAILEMLDDVKEQTDATVLFVSHDMAVHAELVDRLAIMYAGEVVEVGSVFDLFADPKHPYSQRLIGSIPDLHKERSHIEAIPGMAPSPLDWPQGCRFHPRCPQVMDICRDTPPELAELAPGYAVACHLYSERYGEPTGFEPKNVDTKHGGAE